MEEGDKGPVCVTGGTGYVASWLIMKLLDHGYRVRTTVRSCPDNNKDLSFLTNLPGASEKLQIFSADLEQPESFEPAIEGCIGVFHVAHPIYHKEPEEFMTKRAVRGTLGILKTCLKSKTVKRVLYTSSASTIVFRDKGSDVLDESYWSDIDYMKSLNFNEVSYMISKVKTERAASEFAEKHGMDLVTVIPTFINGPFICPNLPSSLHASMALIFGNKDQYNLLSKVQMVHVDDVVKAHIFLFECPDAKGRFICSRITITIDQMAEFLSGRYPEYLIPTPDSLKEIERLTCAEVASKKLLEMGFKYKYGLEEMYDDAIRCCKEKGFL
ncbi:vestitone reductase-like [Diospyros lotus]|uniref:vestitone reductase-like n=1 Tax=Diospyros lotus TaxID=55363 RepID=UPI00224E4474|nr:vestitone reductase-like [Diospyros lotus]